ncbi:CDP-glucose 4,6-dehydratase [Novosphingopyxis sp.]|uniref:CDP-glucose 4,6-dehydratase n=1 Tax=Novosphingopyxis sp. TaxID=2709690 RepID=UPI003B5B15F9
MSNPRRDFWNGRRVLLTGHTGFKGSWTALWLKRLGAEVSGFALVPETEPSLWRQVGDGLLAHETIADIADRVALADAIDRARPQIVLHMAAQALVRTGYRDPIDTMATNAMGTAYLLEALRDRPSLEAVLVVTTDKVYANSDTGRDFVESDPLGGHDPYSASKAAAEIMTASYAASYFARSGVGVATARAGNVIGGGDWSADRLVPDIWRAAKSEIPLKLRYPGATRPWQHVLEPVAGYLCYLEALAVDKAVPPTLNFGPYPQGGATVAQVAESMSKALGVDTAWERDVGDHPRESALLSLDPSLAGKNLGWKPRLDQAATLDWTADWYARHREGEDATGLCFSQIDRYEALA